MLYVYEKVDNNTDDTLCYIWHEDTNKISLRINRTVNIFFQKNGSFAIHGFFETFIPRDEYYMM